MPWSERPVQARRARAPARFEITGSENAAAKLKALADFTQPRPRATSYAPVCMRSKSSPIVENGAAYVVQGELDLTSHAPNRIIGSVLDTSDPSLENLTVDRTLEFITTPTESLVD